MLGEFKKGETIIAVSIAIIVFSMVAVISVSAMNSSLAVAQTALEVTMARNEIDAQVEALRFINNAFIGERNLDPADRQFTTHWEYIETLAIPHADASDINFDAITCDHVYDPLLTSSVSNRMFVVNTRHLVPSTNLAVISDTMVVSTASHIGRFIPSPINSRVVFGLTEVGVDNSNRDVFEGGLFRSVQSVEGLYVVAVAGPPYILSHLVGSQPEFYDFYVRACWRAYGGRTLTSIGTVVRLYNARVIE